MSSADEQTKPGQVAPKGEGEWLIDDSTKQLYLSLLATQTVKPDERAGAKPGTARSRAGEKPAPNRSETKPKTKSPEPVIVLADTQNSLSRFLFYAAGIVVAAALLYKVMVRPSGASPGQSAGRRGQKVSSTAARNSVNASGAPVATGAGTSPETAATLAGPGSLTIAPSFLVINAQPETTSTYSMMINNLTPLEFTFELEARDLVLDQGKPTFVAAGEVSNSVAAGLTFTKRSLNVKSGQAESFDLTLTMPKQTQVRGMLVLLKGTDQIADGSDGTLTASLGTFISFNGTGPWTAQSLSVPSGTNAPQVHYSVSQWLTEPPPKCSDLSGLQPTPNSILPANENGATPASPAGGLHQ